MHSIRDIRQKFRSPDVYEIYSACMYHPTLEKFCEKADLLVHNDCVKLIGLFEKEELLGVCAVKFLNPNTMELEGIAVKPDCRKQGVGRRMIQYLLQQFPAKTMIAETDDDAVKFYQSCGFETVKLIREYHGEKSTRYRCTWHR